MKTSTWNAGLLGAILLLFTAWNILRTARAALEWQTLNDYGAPAGYILISGLAWAFSGIFLTWAIVWGWKHTRRAGIAISVLYWVWYWADRLFVQQSPAPNLVFSAIFSVALALIILLLWLLPQTNTLDHEELE